MTSDARHEPTRNRFAIGSGAQTSVLKYREEPGRIVFIHTEVPPELEGQGIGAQLAQSGLEYARARHLKVVPRCPFVASFIEHHPEFRELVGT